jgi:hypothetical protein
MGLVVCGGLMLAGMYSNGPLIIGLIASLAFGSTALMTLTAIGGSTPLIYTFFSGALVLVVAARRKIWTDVGGVFGRVRPVWVLCALMIYAVIGAWLFPRLFQGQASVFVTTASRGGIVESLLGPVSGNITQTGYLGISALTAIALLVLLLHSDRLDQVRRGFLLLCLLHTGMGLLDLAGKLSGLGDVLSPIRTADYAMATNQVLAGFTRINGAFPEPSAFSAASLACLAFSYTFWRHTGDRLAKWLAILLVALLMISTSSTAYGGLAIMGVAAGLGILRSLVSNRMQADDLRILALLAAGSFMVLALSVCSESALRPVADIIDESLLNKAGSASGQERMYWNTKSLQAFFDTFMLGIGMGSSRASSWPVAVLSQLGLLSAVLMTVLLGVVARGLGRYHGLVDAGTAATVASVRAAALASVLAATLISGSPDPGMLFFIALAVITAARTNARFEIAQTSSALHFTRRAVVAQG